MPKISSYQSVGETINVSDNNDLSLTTNLDDQLWVKDHGSLTFNPSTQWVVKKHQNVTTKDDVFDVIKGRNFFNDKEVLVKKKGFYYNDSMLQSGIIPVNFSFVNNNNDIKITSLPNTFKLGYYSQDGNSFPIPLDLSQFRISSPDDNFPYSSGLWIDDYQPLNISRILIGLSKLKGVWGSNNTTNPNPFTIYFIKCYQYTTNKEIVVISTTSILLEKVDINSVKSTDKLIISFNPITKNSLLDDDFYTVSSVSEFYMIDANNISFEYQSGILNTTWEKLGKVYSSFIPIYPIANVDDDELFPDVNRVKVPIISNESQSVLFGTTVSHSFETVRRAITTLFKEIVKYRITTGELDQEQYLTTSYRLDEGQSKLYYKGSFGLYSFQINEFFNSNDGQRFLNNYPDYYDIITNLIIDPIKKRINTNPNQSNPPQISETPDYDNNNFYGLSLVFYNIWSREPSSVVNYTSNLIVNFDANNKSVSYTKTTSDKWARLKFKDILTKSIEELLELVAYSSYIETSSKSHFPINIAYFHPGKYGRIVNCSKVPTIDQITSFESNSVIPTNSVLEECNIYTFDRLYDSDFKFATIKQPITNKHFSDVRKVNDDILMSNEIDEILGLDQITDDYFISTLLNNDDEKFNILYNDATTEIDKQSILEKASQNFDNQISSTIDTLNSQISSSDSENIDILTENANISKYEALKGLEAILDGDDFKPVSFDNLSKDEIKTRYGNFKKLFLSKVVDETKTGIIGHTRILATNVEQSPLYNSLITEYNFSKDEIVNYSKFLKTEYDSMLNTDVWTIVDALDNVNEVNMINSMVSDQMNELNKLFENIEKDINGVRDSGNEKLNQLNDKISNIVNVANNTANSIIESANQFNNKAQDMIDQAEGSYDQLLISRNVDKSTSYLKGFASALLSDPYLALKQHLSYIKDRVSKLSIKASVIKGLLNFMDFIPKLPNIVIDGIGTVSKIIGTMVGFALKTAIETVIIIDNIDKIIFISEQYLSKGIVGYSTVPTVFDKMFEPPSLIPGLTDIQYSGIKSYARIDFPGTIGIRSIIGEKLINTKNNPIIIEGKHYSYNDYDQDLILGQLPGYYYPKDSNDNLPIIMQRNLTTTSVYPDLTEFSPEYPQRGSLWKLFLTQLNYGESSERFEFIQSLSNYIPITIDMIAIYGIISAGLGYVAGLAASAQALLKGDLIGAIAGAIGAYTVVAGANAYEVYNIVNKRTTTLQNTSVYTHFRDDYDRYCQKWQELVPNLISQDKYVFVLTNTNIPLFSDASDFKKLYLQIKEILFLVGNIVTMGAVSLLIGKLGQKIGNKVRSIRQRRGIKNRNKAEREKYTKVADKRISDLDKEIELVNNDQNLTDKEKKEKIKVLEKDKKNVKKWLAGEYALNPTNKAGINNILSANWGVSQLATSSAAPAISAMSSLGPLTEKALSSFKNDINKLEKLDPSINKENQAIIDSVGDLSTGVTSILGSTSDLLKSLIKVEKDVDEIKRFV